MSSPDECEKLYEEALWCLYALQDDLLQKDNPYIEEDRETISTCTSFLVRCFADVLNVSGRDQADEAASRPVPRAHGHERPRSPARRQRRREPLRRTSRSASVGRPCSRAATFRVAAVAPSRQLWNLSVFLLHVLDIGHRCTLLLIIGTGPGSCLGPASLFRRRRSRASLHALTRTYCAHFC